MEKEELKERNVARAVERAREYLSKPDWQDHSAGDYRFVSQAVVALAEELAAEREKVRILEAEVNAVQDENNRLVSKHTAHREKLALNLNLNSDTASWAEICEKLDSLQAALANARKQPLVVGEKCHEVSDLYGVPGRMTHEYHGKWNESYADSGVCAICGQPKEHEVHTKHPSTEGRPITREETISIARQTLADAEAARAARAAAVESDRDGIDSLAQNQADPSPEVTEFIDRNFWELVDAPANPGPGVDECLSVQGAPTQTEVDALKSEVERAQNLLLAVILRISPAEVDNREFFGCSYTDSDIEDLGAYEYLASVGKLTKHKVAKDGWMRTVDSGDVMKEAWDCAAMREHIKTLETEVERLIRERDAARADAADAWKRVNNALQSRDEARDELKSARQANAMLAEELAEKKIKQTGENTQ